MQKNRQHFLRCAAVLVGLAVFAFVAKAEAPMSSPPPLYLTAQTENAPLTPHIRIFPDPQKNLSFTQILLQYKAGGGQASVGKAVQAAPGAAWYVFTVYNRADEQTRWMLDLGHRRAGTSGLSDRIAFFSDAAPDRALAVDGRHVKNKQQLAGQEKNAVPLQLEADQPRTFAFYIEPTPGVPFAFTPGVQSVSYYKNARAALSSATTITIGGTALLSIIVLLFIVQHRSAVPVLIAGYFGLQLLIYLTTDEILPQGNNTAAVYIDVLYAVAAFIALQLTQHILFPHPKDRRGYAWLVPAAQAVVVVAAASRIWLSDTSVLDMVMLRGMPVALPSFIAAISLVTAFTRAVPQSLIYALSWVLLLAGVLSGTFGLATEGVCYALHTLMLAWAGIGALLSGVERLRRRQKDLMLKQEEEKELQKTREMADQARLLSVMQRERELVSDLRGREAERIQALQRAKEAADAASRAKSEFMAVISHEIRTPMTGVMGMIRLLLDTPLEAKQKEWAQTIQYAGDALLGLLNDILDFSKVEEGKMDIESINFDIVKMIDSLVVLMSGRSEEKKIILKAEIDPDVPAIVKGDPTRIRQVLLNLIGNSIKFTEKGGVTLIVKVKDQGVKGPNIYFAVKDTGIGISPEAQKRLFTPYQQENAGIARRFGGTGLGLSISKKLVAAMGGHLKLQSVQGEGSTFYFTLPLQNPSADSEAHADGKKIEVKPLHILVADDNPINQQVMAGLLEKDGHTIRTASNGQAALDAAKDTYFDVILMDMEMPVLTGPEATRMIRALPDKQRATVPIIAMTANIVREDILVCLQSGMNDYCAKPVNPDKLRAMLQKVANKEGSFKETGYKRNVEDVVLLPGAGAVKPVVSSAEVIVTPTEMIFAPETMQSLKTGMKEADFNELIRGLWEQAETLITASEAALKDGDMGALAARGHDITGMTSNFGFMALSVIARQVYKMAKEKAPKESLTPLVERMRSTYTETRKSVEDWLKKKG